MIVDQAIAIPGLHGSSGLKIRHTEILSPRAVSAGMHERFLIKFPCGDEGRKGKRFIAGLFDLDLRIGLEFKVWRMLICQDLDIYFKVLRFRFGCFHCIIEYAARL